MKSRAKSLSNFFYYISSLKFQNLFGSAIKSIHQEHPQIGKTYIGKIDIYLNVAKTEDIIIERELKPWQTSKFFCIYQVRFEHIINQGANKILYDSLSNLKSY